MLWVDISENEKAELQKYVQFRPNELLIICYCKSVEYILFLTTQRIIIISNGIADSYSYEKIKPL